MEEENHEAGDIESEVYSNNASSLLFNTRKPNIERDFWNNIQPYLINQTDTF